MSWTGAAQGKPIVLDRVWKPGENVELAVPPNMRQVPMPDNPNRIALVLGPMLLAAVWDEDTDSFGLPPAFVRRKEGGPSFPPLLPENDEVSYKSVDSVAPFDLRFVPFYTVQAEKYSVFLDKLALSEWNDRVEVFKLKQMRLRELEARTMEFVNVGSQQDTRDNNLKSENSFTGTLNERRWRDARDGGFFEFDIKVDPNGPNQLMLTYWGSDGGNRVFDILVDGKVVATQRLTAERQGEFIDVVHDLPQDMTKGKEKVVVRIQAKSGAMAGGVFGVRTLRPKANIVN
jgi:hypothetical protein